MFAVTAIRDNQVVERELNPDGKSLKPGGNKQIRVLPEGEEPPKVVQGLLFADPEEEKPESVSPIPPPSEPSTDDDDEADGDDDDEEVDPDTLTDAELRSMLKERGVDVKGNWGRRQLLLAAKSD